MAFIEDPTSEVEGAAPPPEEAQNRTFIILAAALGGLFVIGLLCLGAYVFFISPRQQGIRLTQVAQISLTNEAINAQATAMAEPTNTPILPTEVPSETPLPAPTDTPPPAATDTPLPPAPTSTRLSAAAATNTPGGAVGSATPTPLVGGLRPTATRTAVPTQLPGTGFADEAGVPGLILLSLALVAVVIIARRLRLNLR